MPVCRSAISFTEGVKHLPERPACFLPSSQSNPSVIRCCHFSPLTAQVGDKTDIIWILWNFYEAAFTDLFYEVFFYYLYNACWRCEIIRGWPHRRRVNVDIHTFRYWLSKKKKKKYTLINSLSQHLQTHGLSVQTTWHKCVSERCINTRSAAFMHTCSFGLNWEPNRV